ncbi:secondary thiamine-phosphate synthase enzyme YjbQ [Legionella londiniensis]|uniref:Secondary thiamine-phosphate synthase enzyme n=1 Tax=Legionella londiniensis TaxID=45068 RepID=A0A0W0VPH1_9GAMM|nr:secondary thiamine-phosphate synthase enzyme YjbQ [Legionella londiniensis]KTD21935.1 hypothetical protein Llon_1100 [Legionella londiniensis]STX92582.1 Uncharacterized conserved protein [Legionella londiniensis]
MTEDKRPPVYWQRELAIAQKPRGFHLITAEIDSILKAMPAIKTGLLHLFLKHTSASLCLSENTCREVRSDLERFFNRTVPEEQPLYQHTLEGPDDMPAHIKNVLLGASLTLPLKDGAMQLGQWQGIMLSEHRNHAPPRTIILTAHGILSG